MNDTDKDIEFEDCSYSDKYEKMGVTPQELYFRQQGLCNLQLIYDKIEGKEVLGGLYCTDGKDFAPFGYMLNPTFECIQCVTQFIMNELNNNMLPNNLDKFIVSLLMSISEARQKEHKDLTFYMSKETFELVEDHINNRTLFSEATKPIKVLANGDLLLLGVPVIFKDIEEGSILLEPCGFVLKSPNEK